MNDLTPVMTHPTEAWLVGAMPVLVLAAVLLLASALLTRPLQRLLLARLAVAGGTGVPPALQRPLTPEPPHILLGLAALAVALGIGLTVLVGGVLITLLVAPLATAAVLWALLAVRQARALQRLTSQIVPAAGDVLIQVQGGVPLAPALAQVAASLPPELAAEWGWLGGVLNRPLPDADTGAVRAATLADGAVALAVQTPSPRHARFLRHLAAIATKPAEVQNLRLTSVVRGMRRSDMRERETRAALAELRYGGLFIGVCTTGTLIYTVQMMEAQAARAFAGFQGVVVLLILGLAVAAPIVAGVLASRTGELDY